MIRDFYLNWFIDDFLLLLLRFCSRRHCRHWQQPTPTLVVNAFHWRCHIKCHFSIEYFHTNSFICIKLILIGCHFNYLSNLTDCVFMYSIFSTQLSRTYAKNKIEEKCKQAFDAMPKTTVAAINMPTRWIENRAATIEELLLFLLTAEEHLFCFLCLNEYWDWKNLPHKSAVVYS